MSKKIPVLISGLPGNMARKALEGILQQEDMNIVHYALTGQKEKPLQFNYRDKSIQLVMPDYHRQCLIVLRLRYEDLIIVDYSKGKMEENGGLYAQLGIPFVYGGTIGDRATLENIVRNSQISAVISPNMSVPINLFPGSLLKELAEQFPRALEGCKANIRETHQSTKKDVSGTARAWKPLLEELGMEVKIESIRDQDLQRKLGVPEKYLAGHAYHWVDITSPDGTVRLGWYTQVNGRDTYRDGTIKAIRYLHRKMREGSRGEVFSVMDVIRDL